MNSRTIILISFFMLFVSFPAMPNEPASSKFIAAKNLYKAMKVDESWQDIVDRKVKSISSTDRQGKKMTIAQVSYLRERMRLFLESNSFRKNFDTAMVRKMSEIFTLEELNAVTKFYLSKVGQLLAQNLVKISKEFDKVWFHSINEFISCKLPNNQVKQLHYVDCLRRRGIVL